MCVHIVCVCAHVFECAHIVCVHVWREGEKERECVSPFRKRRRKGVGVVSRQKYVCAYIARVGGSKNAGLFA